MINKLEVLKLLALETKYNSTNESHLQAAIKDELKQHLDEVIQHHYYTQSQLTFWYKNSEQFSLNKAAFYFLSQIIKTRKDFNPDSLHEKKLLTDAYYLAVQTKNMTQAKHYLEILATISDKWQEELALYYINTEKDYAKSAAEYIALYNNSADYKQQKYYFFKVIETYQYGEFNNNAVLFARQHESDYYQDEEASAQLMKLYLATENLMDANRIAKQRLKRID